jgi:hypothetical protein
LVVVHEQEQLKQEKEFEAVFGKMKEELQQRIAELEDVLLQ